ncbi:fat-like cadherin-related tumor suppressor homolog [Paramacrobiotus metropolitanus]|uniref:fat-like cadherin-related tumor suppressor homolog n=1 Tax=Paramacrobiotus metropolitanus TaxID=2943436 RepID=UPI0024460FA5|nr:fat-like cadherin-related tumor suppressor homolog [Paramacrobiotus metropolitanus]XP_055333668.1 fat-like cadherin-related tumor suppressor homolog [Paramacrobiotus metropolitanus]XP_055333669.1 fat-like cadherin-related tumor suppressor homolog [Paramacrobiotus metropolitanus]XP_055333670.1 fat-like cadherin-related tumor suppressor homolog [Paramacrobiotus metropolitanus]XP_055333671.1 fat-like cadherin-related tumor suppressor homolog [Paramacrobiotus metropolitanus]
MFAQFRKWRWRWKSNFPTVIAVVLVVHLIVECCGLNQASFKFTQQSYNVSIPESPDGKAYAVPDIHAERMGIPISDPNVEIRYRVISGDKRKIFRALPVRIGDFRFCVLRPRSSTGSRLNRELDRYYELTIEGTAKGFPGLAALTSVNVTVLDKNDLSPLFYPTKYTVTIDEDVPLHSKILQVTATDADAGLNGDIYYVIHDPTAGSFFTIHPQSGILSAIRPPNVDIQKDFRISVNAHDRGVKSNKIYMAGGEMPSNADVIVQVRRANRNAPGILVQSLSALTLKTHPLAVGILQVTDPDPGLHGQIDTVQVVDKGNYSNWFYTTPAGTPGSYYIQVRDRAWLQNMDNIVLTIKATDRGLPAQSSWKVVNVSLFPVNEHAPKLQIEHLTLDIPENLPVNTFLTHIRATDEDAGRNGRVRFSLLTRTDIFRINSITGWIILLRPLDRETRNVYELEVVVTDDAPEGQQKSDAAKITMKIVDENDNDPVFAAAEVSVDIVENEPAGSIIYTASAHDQDIGDNALISYSIANLNEIPFQIDAHTGQIRLLRNLDYEVDKRDYLLRVRAADRGQPLRRESEMTLIVRLRDRNDNAPVFKKLNCHGTIAVSSSSATTAESNLLTLSAIDADESDAVTYKLLNDEEPIRKCFGLNQSTGDVTLTCDLKKDLIALNGNDIALRFTATDGSLEADKMLWVNLTLSRTDARLNTPTDRSINIQCQPNPQASLLAGIQQQSAENNARMDTFPHMPEFALTNRRTPKFPTDFPAIIHLDEDSEVESKVLQLNAIDEDYGYNGLLRYSAVSDDDYFRCNPEGQLVLARPLDRESKLMHSVNITVEDSGSPPRTSSRLLLVKVLDKNDNSPQFDPVGCAFSVAENSAHGSVIGFIKATDADEGLNGRITYSTPSAREPFAIHPESGALSIHGRIDYETVKEYRFTVLASDSSVDTAPRTSSLECSVAVVDANDNAPLFPSSLIKISIPEDFPVGAVLTFVTALDVDSGHNGQVEYSLAEENDISTSETAAAADRKQTTEGHQPNADSLFAVHPLTGALTLRHALDFEMVSVYNISVVAQDKGQPRLSSTAWVEIFVEDVDENLHAPKFKDFVLSASVLENQPVDTFVTQVKAIDEDGDKVAYSLVGGSGLHLFRMDSDGLILTSAVFDREAQEHYWLKILAKDSAAVPKYSVLHCYVKIGDTNDNNPMTAEPIYYTSVPENSPPDTVVATLDAFDLDSTSSQLTYKITAGNPQGFFTIQEKTGIIRTTNRKFDRETQAEHTLEITISDNGEPTALQSTTFVVVTVQDVQDSSVSFLKEHVQRYVVPAWKPPKALPLFRVIAFDTDIGNNAEIRFSLTGKKVENERYRIDTQTGEVFAAQPLNVGEDYNVVVKASDPEDSAQKKTLRVVLEASAIPGSTTKPPQVTPTTASVTVSETSAVGHLVHLLEAEDPDGDMLWYYIVGGDPEKQFHIGPNMGNLIVARPLDWEAHRNYTLTINVTDGVHFVSTVLLVKIADVNEHRPQFIKRSFIASVPENASPGSEVVRVAASDQDEEQRLLYSIHATGSPVSAGKFHIDEHTGVITTAEALDRETVAQHILTVMVKDRGAQSRGDLAKVLINVIDLNDHAPVFTEVSQPVVVQRGLPAGATVLTMRASDRDTGLNAEVTYSLTASQSLLEIDALTGDVRLLQNAEKLGSDELAVKIVASDKGIPPLKTEALVLVKLADENALAPFGFPQRERMTFIAENAPAGTFVAVVAVGVQSFVTYQLSDRGNGDKNAFMVDPSSGLVTTSMPLDYEKQRSYVINVMAVNRHYETATCTVSVFVKDLNDNAPRMNFTSLIGSVSEASPVGSSVLDPSGRPLILAAWDADNGVNSLLFFEVLQPEISQYFEVLSSGSVRLRSQIDYEKHRQFQFLVRVSDAGRPRLSSDQSTQLTINVINVNDCPPVFTADEYNFTLTIPVYPAMHVGRVTAEDADLINSTLTYKIIAGNPNRTFTLHPAKGDLQLNNHSLDVSAGEVRSLTVQVSDGLHTATAKVFVTFTEVENKVLKFSQAKYTATIKENDEGGKEVFVPKLNGRFLGENIRYEMMTENPWTVVDSLTGAVMTTNVSLDREQTKTITLVMEAVSFAEATKQKARTEIEFTVLDVNDNPPKFNDSVYVMAVPVYGKQGLIVGKVTATDADEGKNGVISYAVISYQPLISINSSTGDVSLARDLTEQELTQEFSYTIRASDSGNISLHSDATVLLRIVADTVPLFPQNTYRTSVSEAAEVGTPLLTVSATYASLVNTSRDIVYTIMEGDRFNNFDIDFTTGVIRLLEPVDFELQKQFTLRVRAMDPAKWETLYSDIVVFVDILDANDNAPKTKDGVTFQTIKLAETTPRETEIYQLLASDADSGENAELHFSLQWSEDAARETVSRIRNRKSDEDVFFRCGIKKGLSGAEEFKAGDYFQIDSTSGKVYLINELDREMIDQLDLTIIVSDAGHPRRSSAMTLRVVVKDINDVAPCFTDSSYDFVVSDEIFPGKFIGGVVTVDHDAESDMQYSIVDGNGDELFTIDRQGIVAFSSGATGFLWSSAQLNISASDGVHVAYTQVNILPVISNRHSPKFDWPFYALTTAENAPLGSVIGAVRASDLDAGRNGQLRYSIVEDVYDDRFVVDAESGVISVAGNLDRERQADYLFWIQAVDLGGLRDFCQVNITLTDMNDKAPVFAKKIYTVTVFDNLAADAAILKVEATDRDLGQNGSVVYSISLENSRHFNLFYIDSRTGIIKLKKPFGTEFPNEKLSFFVDASDEGSPLQWSSVAVEIFVVDNTNILPEFDQLLYLFSIHENAPMNTTLLTVRLKQPKPVIFTVISPSALNQTELPFSIRQDGRLVVSKELDFEAQNKYRFFVQATFKDNPLLVSHVELQVRINDENDNAPVFFADKVTVQTPENYTAPVRLIPISAYDLDYGQNAMIRYELVNASHLPVALDPKSGWLTLERTIDREMDSKIVVKVMAVDSGVPALSSTMIVEIDVLDINDNPPYFPVTHTQASVKEEFVPDIPIVAVRATDLDQTAALEYYITKGDPSRHFVINSKGEVSVVAALDREEKSSYDLTLVATDGLGTATTQLHIDVLDINDNTPICTKSSFHEILPEDMDVGHIVLRMQATDEDIRNEIEYVIVGDNSDDFTMDRATGLLRIKQHLDRETTDRYALLGIASDEDGRSCSASIEIVVTDVNDNAPSFPDNLTVAVSESTAPGTLLYRLKARDRDLGMNRLVKYAFLPNDQESEDNIKLFSLNETNGFIHLTGAVDRETTPRYDLRFRAKDAGSPSLWSMVNLKVFVQNVRDDPPKFSEAQYQFNVPENTRIGSKVGQVEATSLDDAVRGDLYYRITDGNQLGVFDVDGRNGEMVLLKELDFEKQPEFIVFLEAHDSSEPPLVGITQVLIHVTDFNDNPPIFLQNQYVVKISEDVDVGAQVIQVTANDVDTKENGKVSYMFPENSTYPFHLDPETGWVTVASALDREQNLVFLLTVKAIDSGTPALSALTTVEIALLDVNDCPPQFSQPNYTAVLQEKRPGGFTILRFDLNDADLDPNGQPFALEITAGNDEGLFQVTSSDLSLRTTRPLLDRRHSEFNLTITATDNGSPSMNASTWITIRIVEESQFPPKINPTQISVLSTNGKFAGGVIGRIAATDADIYDLLNYDIASPELKTYFDMDALQGNIIAKAGVVPGLYDLNVSVTDGRFTTFEKIPISVMDVNNEMLDSGVTVQLDDVSVEEFVSTYKRDFIRAVRQLFGLRRNKDVHIISVQPYEVNDLDRKKRDIRDFSESVQVLFALSKGKNGDGYIEAEEVRGTLQTQQSTFENLMDLKGVRVVPKLCAADTCVFGQCQENLRLLDHSQAQYVSVTGSNGQSYVYPRHEWSYRCVCQSGYSGLRCERPFDECATKACTAPKECVSMGNGETKCLCPNGKEGLKCDQRSPFGEYDDEAITYSGNSYAWYDLQKPIERHLSLSMKFKTRFDFGNLMYVAGRLDYSILEIKSGVVQYRFDCGSGEGLAKLEGIYVSDNQWHELTVQRHGRHAEIRLDGKFVAQATAPGINDILNLEGNDVFFGAEVPGRFSAASAQRSSLENIIRDVRRGFIGCMKRIQINGVELPKVGRNPEATLIQLANIRHGCHITTGDLGPCASMPCQNGAFCEPNSQTAFVCRCPPRFSGTFCENDSNPCASLPCLHGTCTNRPPNDFHCSCPAGLTGKRCEYGRFCNPNPCKNGGCEEGTMGPICQCLHGYEGTLCERDVNECLQSPCHNGGTCENLMGGFRCNCSVQFRGTMCEESVFIPNITRGVIAGWTWIEILIVIGIVFLVTLLGVLLVLCRKRFRKRRATGLEYQFSQDSTGSPTTHTINNDISRLKLCNNRVAAEDTLLKRGSKISNLEAAEARQPMLINEHGSVRGSGTRNRPPFRPMTPPPPSHSATSSETASLHRRSNMFDGDDERKRHSKGFVVDMPNAKNTLSANNFRNIAKNKKESSSTINRASSATSPMISDEDDHAVSSLNDDRKDLLWDPTGTTLEAGDSSAATATVSADGPDGSSSIHNELLGDDELSESDCFEVADFVEDEADETAAFLSPIQPPTQFRDLLQKRMHLPDDDYVLPLSMAKRFSDYIPAADIDGSRENVSEVNGAKLAKGDSELDLPVKIDIPPPMKDLNGYESFRKRQDAESRRPFLSSETLSAAEAEDDLENGAMLNGRTMDDLYHRQMSLPDTSEASGKLWDKEPSLGTKLSSALGKQTQV